MTFQNNSPILAKRGIVIVSEYERFLYVLREGGIMLKLTAPFSMKNI